MTNWVRGFVRRNRPKAICMEICRTIAEVRRAVTSLRKQGSIGLVPTMGALHRGHMSLVGAAREQHDNIVATIFVNPTQFGNSEDLETYPKTEAQDLEMLAEAGVGVVFIPNADEIYPDGDQTIVETVDLANAFHGAVRPGHFRGVATVVCKLFNIVQPDAAYFGKKDFQQLFVIRRMVRDLHFPMDIIGVETARDHDGVALSSRNVRLSSEQRAAAPILNAALERAEVILKDGATAEAAISSVQQTIGTEPLGVLKAVDIVDTASFQRVTGVPMTSVGIMISVLFGDVLLIDQREVAL